MTWEVQCISDWDGDPGEEFRNDTERGGNGDGPGCIQAQGGQQHCGQAQPLTVDGNVPITYISPDKLFDNEFLANVCSNQNDDGNGYVPLTITLQATGCTRNQSRSNGVHKSHALERDTFSQSGEFAPRSGVRCGPPFFSS